MGSPDPLKWYDEKADNPLGHTTDLEAGVGLPKDTVSRAELMESNAKKHR